ncbi:MAG: PTS sugar transporter subunit IIA [Deltaproteobacteria bacterium]|nr:MAG: PTS sugar transporter subunit IIA [Deltaproteobacteria bacterium]
MRIAEFLREDLVFADLKANEKAAVLGEMSAALARSFPSLAAGRLTEALLEREKLGSTGVGEGVAIPHGKLPGLPGLIAAFARKKAGLDFAAIDNKPTFLFFVLFAPENSAGLHLKALARISRLFKQPQLRQAILAAPDAAAIYRLISEEDAKY